MARVSYAVLQNGEQLMRSDYAQRYRELWHQHWWWQSRRRFVLGLIHRIAARQKIKGILDVGCGDALFFEDLMKIAPTWGIEPDESLLDAENPHRQRIEVRDFAQPASTSRRYDLIVMLDVLEHIEDDCDGVKVLYSLLEPGGHAVLTVPAMPLLWSMHDEVNCHFRRYSKKLLRQRLLDQRLEIVRMGYFFFWTVAPLVLRRLVSPARLSGAKRDEYRVSIPSPIINRVLRSISGVDHAIASRFGLPIGSSLYAVCRRPPDR